MSNEAYTDWESKQAKALKKLVRDEGGDVEHHICLRLVRANPKPGALSYEEWRATVAVANGLIPSK